jgi:hypothetical protein
LKFDGFVFVVDGFESEVNANCGGIVGGEFVLCELCHDGCLADP